MSKMRSKSWMPLRDVTPMYRKMPNSTARGMRDRIGSMRMDSPVRRDTLLVQVTQGSAPMELCSSLGLSMKPQVPCGPFLHHLYIGSEGNNLEGYLSKESNPSLPYTHSPSLIGAMDDAQRNLCFSSLQNASIILYGKEEKQREGRENFRLFHQGLQPCSPSWTQLLGNPTEPRDALLPLRPKHATSLRATDLEKNLRDLINPLIVQMGKPRPRD